MSNFTFNTSTVKKLNFSYLTKPFISAWEKFLKKPEESIDHAPQEHLRVAKNRGVLGTIAGVTTGLVLGLTLRGGSPEAQEQRIDDYYNYDAEGRSYTVYHLGTNKEQNPFVLPVGECIVTGFTGPKGTSGNRVEFMIEDQEDFTQEGGGSGVFFADAPEEDGVVVCNENEDLFALGSKDPLEEAEEDVETTFETTETKPLIPVEEEVAEITEKLTGFSNR